MSSRTGNISTEVLEDIINTLMSIEERFIEYVRVVDYNRDGILQFPEQLIDDLNYLTEVSYNLGSILTDTGDATQVLYPYMRRIVTYLDGIKRYMNSTDPQQVKVAQDLSRELPALIQEFLNWYEYSLRFMSLLPSERRRLWTTVKGNDASALVKQLMDNLGKMAHDYSIILSNFINDNNSDGNSNSDGSNPPLNQDTLERYVFKLREFLELEGIDDVTVYSQYNIINLQAVTGHSVKVILNQNRIWGHLGDALPQKIQTVDLKFKDQKTLMEGAKIVGKLMHLEQEARKLTPRQEGYMERSRTLNRDINSLMTKLFNLVGE